MKVNLSLFLRSKKLGRPFLVEFSAHENRFIFVIFLEDPVCMRTTPEGKKTLLLFNEKKRNYGKGKTMKIHPLVFAIIIFA